jgi:hypothetical protein
MRRTGSTTATRCASSPAIATRPQPPPFLPRDPRVTPVYSGAANVAPDLGLELDGSAALDGNRTIASSRSRQQRADGVKARMVGRLRPGAPYLLTRQ